MDEIMAEKQNITATSAIHREWISLQVVARRNLAPDSRSGECSVCLTDFAAKRRDIVKAPPISRRPGYRNERRRPRLPARAWMFRVGCGQHYYKSLDAPVRHIIPRPRQTS
ncbi:hypothetical protein [Rhodoblastus sp.]|uniref:hypothetical protein n=1 Tax=Rhodoblastus sp. TaxID=1962975 RepID=UPI00260AA46E|nr:hypothetical protein [Rhodoblastus sp.]